MKYDNRPIITLSCIAIIIIIGLGLLFVHNGFEKNFIHKVPLVENNEYSSLLNLYQTRVNVVNWGIACIGALLTFLAFHVQYKFNDRQKEDLETERYENKLFHLLDNYRDICSHMSIPRVGEGKMTFHYMFYEYKAIFYMISNDKDILKEITIPEEDNTWMVYNYIAFTYFLNGVTASSINAAVDDKIITENGKNLIQNLLLNKQIESENYHNGEEGGVKYIMDYRHKNIKYFDGHRFRIIPYMKYISLIVDYIISRKETSDASIKYLISEQTDHEIALIYAYRGYKKYRGRITDNNKAVEDLYQKMYDDLPSHMIHKFKYDSGKFFS